MRVMGIDPGLAATGYAVVEGAPGRLRALALGVVTTEAHLAPAARLARLRTGLLEVMLATRPAAAAVESFWFHPRVRAAMAVCQAAGVALAASAEAGLDVEAYAPAEVKQAVVGVGNAPKGQVQAMVAALLKLTHPPDPPDAADACALAICHLNRSGLRRALTAARARTATAGEGAHG